MTNKKAVLAQENRLLLIKYINTVSFYYYCNPDYKPTWEVVKIKILLLILKSLLDNELEVITELGHSYSMTI